VIKLAECPDYLPECGKIGRPFPVHNFIQGTLGDPTLFGQLPDTDPQIMPEKVIKRGYKLLI
jgi:hypothetical protein